MVHEGLRSVDPIFSLLRNRNTRRVPSCCICLSRTVTPSAPKSDEKAKTNLLSGFATLRRRPAAARKTKDQFQVSRFEFQRRRRKPRKCIDSSRGKTKGCAQNDSAAARAKAKAKSRSLAASAKRGRSYSHPKRALRVGDPGNSR